MEHHKEVRRTPPLVFQATRWLQSRQVRGAYRLESFARTCGWLDVVVRYRLGSRAAIDVPLSRRPYALRDILDYERSALSLVTAQLKGIRRPTVLYDCGADVGVVSARLVQACPQIQRAVAFEPNRESFETLVNNMALLDAEARAECAAVSDFSGRGTLVHPPHSSHDHAAYLVPTPTGDVEVTTIDAQATPPEFGVVLKIDVEGGEEAVLRGAKRTLERAPFFIVSFEAHRTQTERTGVEPIDVLRRLLDARPCDVQVVRSCVSEIPESPKPVRLDVPFFRQFTGANVYNIVASSR